MKLVRTRLLLLAALVAAVAAGLVALPAQAAKKPPAQKRPVTTGIVDIFTTLGYQSGKAAGTGMIVSPSGEVLTNNHVIRGATVFKVVDVTTRKTYTADVVGYSVSQDVAVLQLLNADNLSPIALGNSSKLRVGQPVAALGNAGGQGTRRAASGTVTALRQSITAYDGSSGSSERLSGLVETNARVRPGDSGGPLFNAKWRAIGMVTAGSSTTLGFSSTGGLGYAIPINRALVIAKQIRTGQASADIHIGATAFLGVTVSDSPSGGGALIRSVIPGSAAEAAGLVAGSLITSLDGTAVGSASELTGIVVALSPGTAYPLEWIDPTGIGRTGQIAPASGPPQ